MDNKNEKDDIFAPYEEIFGWQNFSSNNFRKMNKSVSTPNSYEFPKKAGTISESTPNKNNSYELPKKAGTISESADIRVVKKYNNNYKLYRKNSFVKGKADKWKKGVIATMAGIGVVIVFAGGLIFHLPNSRAENTQQVSIAGDKSIPNVDELVSEYITDNPLLVAKKPDVIMSGRNNNQPNLVSNPSVKESDDNAKKEEQPSESQKEQASASEAKQPNEPQEEQPSVSEEKKSNEPQEEQTSEYYEDNGDKNVINIENIENLGFDIGNGAVDDTISLLNDTYAGTLIKHYCEIYGVDPYLIASICMQESSGIQDTYGNASGIMQLENIEDYEIEVYNYAEQGKETLLISSQYEDDLDYNIHCGVALMRDNIDYFQGNIYAAIQSYNFSKYMVECIFDVNGITLNGYNDCSWIWYMKDASDNPYKYGELSESYGDGNYIENVLSHYPMDEILKYKYKDQDIKISFKNYQNNYQYETSRAM